MLLKISMALVLLSLTAFADRNSQEYKDCSAKYTDKILEGDSEAFKNHIIECQGKPDSGVMFIYSNNSYRSLSPESLICMGDIYSNRAKNVAYSAYKIAAEQGNESSKNRAKVSIGLLLEDKPLLAEMDIDTELKTESIALTKKDKGFNFLRMMLLTTKKLSDEEKKKFEIEYKSKFIPYAKQCVDAVDKDIMKIESKIENMINSSMQEGVSRDYEAWVYVEGVILEDKKKRLKSIKRKFSGMVKK